MKYLFKCKFDILQNNILMGVKGLWEHLLPAGRRIKLEDLEGKILAIDVSIWSI